MKSWIKISFRESKFGVLWVIRILVSQEKILFFASVSQDLEFRESKKSLF